MKNKFIIKENAIFMTVHYKNKRYDAVFDIDDLPKIQAVKGTWALYQKKGSGLLRCIHRGISLHRLVLGAKKGQIIDHINHDTLDNRKLNLRFVTTSQNNQNIIKAYSNSTTGVPNVSKWKNKYRVQFYRTVNGKYKKIFSRVVDDLKSAKKLAIEKGRELYPYREIYKSEVIA